MDKFRCSLLKHLTMQLTSVEQKKTKKKEINEFIDDGKKTAIEMTII